MTTDPTRVYLAAPASTDPADLDRAARLLTAGWSVPYGDEQERTLSTLSGVSVEERRALVAAHRVFAGRGVVVNMPTFAPVDDLEAWLAVIAADLTAAESADVIVTVGDAENLFEVILARLRGVPVLALADVLPPAEVTR